MRPSLARIILSHKAFDFCFSGNVSIPTCAICFEPFQATHLPLSASRSANSSSKLPFGLNLPCPASHTYCLGCLSSYLKNKLDPQGDGSGNPVEVMVFPIRCPECPIVEWAEGIDDSVAERVLDEKGMLLWVGSFYSAEQQTNLICIPHSTIKNCLTVCLVITARILVVLCWCNSTTTRTSPRQRVQLAQR